MRHAAISEFITQDQACEINAIFWEFDGDLSKIVDAIHDRITLPSIEYINQQLHQENDPRYLAYMLAFVFERVTSQPPTES